MKSLKNHHNQDLYVGSEVYYGNAIATITDVFTKRVKVEFYWLGCKKYIKVVNPLKVHLPLITNHRVVGIEDKMRGI